MMKLLLPGVSLVVLLGCAANPLLTGGKVQIQLQNLDKAVELLTENVEKNPGDPEGYLWLGIACGLKKKYEEASKHFDKAVELDSLYLDQMRTTEPDQYWGGGASYWVTYINAGITFMNEQKFELAEKRFLRAAEIQPDSSSSHNYLGYVYSKLGNEDKACESYKTAVELGPKDVDAHLNMAACHLKREEYDEALALLSKAVEIDSTSDRALYLKGICHFQREEYEKAEGSFQKATELNAENKDAVYNLGIIYLKQNKTSEAVQSLARATELAPRDEDAWYQLGTAYYKLEDYEKAEKAFTKVIEINPANADAYENRGYCRSKLGMKQESYKDLEDAERLRKGG